MHSHQGMQEQSLMTAPLIVHSAEDLRADRQEVVLMLHDFSFHTPEELLAGLTKSNGNQSVIPNSGMGHNMNMGSGVMGAMNMESDTMLGLFGGVTSPIFTSDFRLCPQGNAGEIAAVRIWLRAIESTT